MSPSACRQLILIVSLISLFTGFGGCQALSGLDRPDARVTGVNLAGLDLEAATLTFDIAIDNPYSVDLPLVNLGYTLASRGSTFLTGDAPLSERIPAHGSKTITLPARVGFDQLLSAVSGVRIGDVVPYEAQLDLSVDAPGVGELKLPLRKSGEVPVPAPPKVSIADIQWSELSLQGATAVVALDIVNPNQFNLNLERLDYALRLAGEDVGGTSISKAVRLAKNGGSQKVEVPLSFSPISFGTAMLNVLRSGNADYEIGGNMSVETPYGPLTLPFNGSGRAPMSR